MTSLFDLSFEKRSNPIKKGVIYLNERIHLDYEETIEACHFGIFGYSGSGKTYTACLVLSQLPNAIYFDPKGEVDKNIWLMGSTIGEDKEWEHYVFGKVKGKKNQIVINVKEINKLCINVLAEGETDNKKRMINNILNHWEEYQDKEKTYQNFKTLFKKYKQEFLFEDINQILDEKDEAPPLDFYMIGRKIVDIIAINKSSKALGVFIDLLFQARNSKSDWLGIAMDEANTYFSETGTPTGKALINLYVMGRTKKVIALCLGQNYGSIARDVKLNVANYIILDQGLTERFFKQFDVPKEKGDFVLGVLLDNTNKGECFFHCKINSFGYDDFQKIQIKPFFFQAKLDFVKEVPTRKYLEYPTMVTH